MAEHFPEGLEKTPPFDIPYKLRKPYSPLLKGFDDIYHGTWKNYLRNYDLDGNDVQPRKTIELVPTNFVRITRLMLRWLLSSATKTSPSFCIWPILHHMCQWK